MEVIKRRLRAIRNRDTRRLIFRRAKNFSLMYLYNFFSPHPKTIEVDGRKIGEGKAVFIIAEIGINHNGSVEKAKELIDTAIKAGADAVKFQVRNLQETYQKSFLEHPERLEQAYQYTIKLLKDFDLSESALVEVMEYARKKGIMAFGSAFDEASVDILAKLKPPLYKVASADLVDFPLIERLLREHVPLLLSTGMSTLDEIDETVRFLQRRSARFVLLHCQSTYPAPVDALNLAMIPKIRSRYGVPVGYSGHELGILHTLSAVALGATVIERHITLDRTLPGPDHAASLEPNEFAELVTRIREYESAYGVPLKRISRGEAFNRLMMRKSLVAACDIPQGVKITRSMVRAKRPAEGLLPQRLYELVGKKARRAFKADDMFTESDLGGGAEIFGTLPVFSSKWGLKARFFELDRLSRFDPQPVFFEFHATYDDLHYPFDLKKHYPQELLVHAPEYFERELVDLASPDPTRWEASIQVVQRTIDKTREIASCFRGIPKIIIHVGGSSIESMSDRKGLLERAEAAFKRLDTKGVEILPENLPPFGWLFSGLWQHNLFGDADEIIGLCTRLGYRLCLDMSHAWLYCVHNNVNYLEYLRRLAPITGHLHISDGRGSKKEGLQIGDGDVPFQEAFDILAAHLPKGEDVSWVPEIWLGHLDDYYEFRRALVKLAKYPFLYRGIVMNTQP